MEEMPEVCLEQSRPPQVRVPLSLRHAVLRRVTHGPPKYEVYLWDAILEHISKLT